MRQGRRTSICQLAIAQRHGGRVTVAGEGAPLVLELEGAEVGRLHVTRQRVPLCAHLLRLVRVGRTEQRRVQLVIARVVGELLHCGVDVTPVVQARLWSGAERQNGICAPAQFALRLWCVICPIPQVSEWRVFQH